MTQTATSPNPPPYILLGKDVIPDGLLLIEGKNLFETVRAAKIPYGRVEQKGTREQKYAKQPVGILIRTEDEERWNAAFAKRK